MSWRAQLLWSTDPDPSGGGLSGHAADHKGNWFTIAPPHWTLFNQPLSTPTPPRWGEVVSDLKLDLKGRRRGGSGLEVFERFGRAAEI